MKRGHLWPRYSLRGLLGMVAVVAVGCAALFNASAGWLRFVSIVSFARVMIAVIVALFGIGSRRAFAAGFAICSVGYLALIYLVLENENDTMGRLSTTWLLRELHMATSTTVVVPPHAEPPRGIMMIPATPWVVGPPHTEFMQIGQLLWSLLLGCLGGLFARYVCRRRSDTDTHSP